LQEEGGLIETRLLFQTDSYLRTFDAQVIAVNGQEVALDATAFYAGGGGQPCDSGTLSAGAAAWPVVKVRREGPLVWHELHGTPPAVGTTVRGELNWEQRYALMRTHTALHILCGVVWRDYGAKVTGGNMEPLKARMDFEFETMRGELVREIEERVNAEVAAARAIHVSFLPRADADQHPDLIRTKINLLPPGITVVRVVEIEGLDTQADGGTHLANTRDVGRVRVVDYHSKGRINKRIMIEVED
jgi:misacylated tRNA(Ala) deacylase